MTISHQDLDVIRQGGHVEGEIAAIEKLGSEYRKRAGEAFAAGNDEQANTLRESANSMDTRSKRRQAALERQKAQITDVRAKLDAGQTDDVNQPDEQGAVDHGADQQGDDSGQGDGLDDAGLNGTNDTAASSGQPAF